MDGGGEDGGSGGLVISSLQHLAYTVLNLIKLKGHLIIFSAI